MWRVANFREIPCRGFRSLPFLPPLVDPAVFLYFPLSWGSKLWQFACSGCEAAGWQRLCSGRWAAEKHARERERERRANKLAHTHGREDRQRRQWQEQRSSPPTLTLLSVFLSVWLGCRRQSLSPPFVLQWKCECTADASRSEQCIGLMQCSCVLTHSPPPRRVYCLSLSDAHTPIHSPSLPDSLFTVFFLRILWLFLSPLTSFLSILIILFLLHFFLNFPFMLSCGHTLSNSFLAFPLLISFALIFSILLTFFFLSQPFCSMYWCFNGII